MLCLQFFCCIYCRAGSSSSSSPTVSSIVVCASWGLRQEDWQGAPAIPVLDLRCGARHYTCLSSVALHAASPFLGSQVRNISLYLFINVFSLHRHLSRFLEQAMRSRASSACMLGRGGQLAADDVPEGQHLCWRLKHVTTFVLQVYGPTLFHHGVTSKVLVNPRSKGIASA
jgi:hypothetical protein